MNKHGFLITYHRSVVRLHNRHTLVAERLPVLSLESIHDFSELYSAFVPTFIIRNRAVLHLRALNEIESISVGHNNTNSPSADFTIALRFLLDRLLVVRVVV